MKDVKKKSLIIFGYSEELTLGLCVNSKLEKVKKFNIIKDNNEDKFFKLISNFTSNKACFSYIYYSCGPGGFTIIRRIISYIKALKFSNSSNTKFIGLSNLFIIACYLSHKNKINQNKYILSILNYSKDNFVQIYLKKKNSFFFLEKISDIKNIELNLVETYLKTLNLSIQNIHSVYLGINPNTVSFFNNIKLVDRSNILEIIIKISDLVENNKISQTDYRSFFEEKYDSLYGKPPSTN